MPEGWENIYIKVNKAANRGQLRMHGGRARALLPRECVRTPSYGCSERSVTLKCSALRSFEGGGGVFVCVDALAGCKPTYPWPVGRSVRVCTRGGEGLLWRPRLGACVFACPRNYIHHAQYTYLTQCECARICESAPPSCLRWVALLRLRWPRRLHSERSCADRAIPTRRSMSA